MCESVCLCVCECVCDNPGDLRRFMSIMGTLSEVNQVFRSPPGVKTQVDHGHQIKEARSQ